MENKFEKMDEWMMKASREIREQKMPQKELDAFHAGVMKKISAQSSQNWGMPYAGLFFAAALSGAIILGVIFYLHQVQVVPEEKPVTSPLVLIKETQKVPGSSEPLRNLVPSALPTMKETAEPISQQGVIVPKTPAPILVPKVIPVFLPVALVKDEDLLEEIEALKELGVWTEEDEEAAGIPIEAVFLELENDVSENQPSVMTAPAARS